MVLQLVPYQAKSVTVGTSEVELMVDKTNTGRMVMVITNTSTVGLQSVSLGIGHVAVLGVGVTLYPGQSWVESAGAGFEVTPARITAIASAAGATIAIYERAVS